jgi:hypothetical protein
LALEDEERKNQLKWQVKLGENSIEYQAKQDILLSRTQAEHRYKVRFNFFNGLTEIIVIIFFSNKSFRSVNPYWRTNSAEKRMSTRMLEQRDSTTR